MQWTNSLARKKLCELVFKNLSDPKRFEDFTEMFQRYLTTWKDQVRFVKKAHDHFHGLGCNFLQSGIGLTLPFGFQNNKWVFSSWIEYKVKPLKKSEFPCPCIWGEKCYTVETSQDKLRNCPFFAKRERRFDLCWIEESLLDNVAITAEVETGSDIKKDLAKLFSLFRNSTSRGQDGFDSPIIHIQLDLSGKNSEKTIKDFMNRHFAQYVYSPSIIYIRQEKEFSKWAMKNFYRNKIIGKNTIT